jgi:hypothetical protein
MDARQVLQSTLAPGMDSVITPSLFFDGHMMPSSCALEVNCVREPLADRVFSFSRRCGGAYQC